MNLIVLTISRLSWASQLNWTFVHLESKFQTKGWAMAPIYHEPNRSRNDPRNGGKLSNTVWRKKDTVNRYALFHRIFFFATDFSVSYFFYALPWVQKGPKIISVHNCRPRHFCFWRWWWWCGSETSMHLWAYCGSKTARSKKRLCDW